MTPADAGTTSPSRLRAEEMLAQDPTCRHLAIDLDDIGPGRATLRMRVTDAMANGHGLTHGGYVFLLADAAFAYASNSHGPVALAQHAQITYLRPSYVGDELRAVAVERARHGRTGLYDVTVHGADDVVVAEFRGQSALVPGVRAPAPDTARP